METPTQSEIDKAINLEYNDGSGLWLTSGLTLRRLIGVLGMSLPILLWLYLYIAYGWKEPLESISHYYYTRAGTVFAIIVSLLAIFLIVYKGCKPIDFYLSLTAGIFALCVLLFPTFNLCKKCIDDDNILCLSDYCVTILPQSNARELFHFISAAIFLLCLAAMSLFIFTLSDKPVSERTPNKIIRNRIFRICGVIMVVCLLIIFFGGYLGLIPSEKYIQYHLTFWMEAIAIEAFGFSWLTKGKALIGD
jgi:Mn2+/Fe2+ NRAMP family transporter